MLTYAVLTERAHIHLQSQVANPGMNLFDVESTLLCISRLFQFRDNASYFSNTLAVLLNAH